MYALRKTFLIRENNSSWLNKHVRRLLTVILSIRNNRFLGAKCLGKPPDKETEYFNSPAEKQRETLDCPLKKNSWKHSYNAAFSKTKSLFSDQVKNHFIWHE